MELGPILRSMRKSRMRFALVVLQSALTLAIVVNCITIVADARAKMSRESGFDDDNILVVDSLPFAPEFKEERFRELRNREDAQALRALLGVRAVSVTRFLPWQGGGSSTMLKREGAAGENVFRTQIYAVDAGILDALGVRLVAGRAFTEDEVDRDTERLRLLLDSERPPRAEREPFRMDVLVSRALAELVFPGEEPLGKVLEDSDGDLYPVVGVFDPFYNPYGWPIHEYAVFYPGRSSSFDAGTRLLVRSEPGQARHLLATLEKALLDAHPGRTVTLRTLLQVRERFHAGSSGVVVLVSTVIVLLVFVTALGIVGLTSFTVAERTRQIGTRRALGATQGDILRHFLVENWVVTSLGAAMGVGLAYGLNFGLVRFIAGAKIGPALVAGGVVVLWAVGLLSTLAPALRGARTSPAIATRNV